jgi:putative oxidoreductase
MGLGLLIFRLVLGLGFAAHGAQKLFGSFGGYGLEGTGGFFAGLGFRPGKLFALAAGLGEFGGGLLTAFGLGGPFGPALMIVVMIVAIFSVHLGKGYFVTTGGPEAPILYIIGALAIISVGPGPYSLDSILGLTWLWTPRTELFALAGAVILGLGSVLQRRPPAPQPVPASTAS